MGKYINKFIFWTPRFLSILFILFLMLFSLDIFELKLGFWGTISGLLMHSIPALFLLIILIISWKYEIIGGIIYIMAGMLYLLMIFSNSNNGFGSIIIAGPAFLIGILFLIGWFKKEKIKRVS